jgi:hypothetical protein
MKIFNVSLLATFLAILAGPAPLHARGLLQTSANEAKTAPRSAAPAAETVSPDVASADAILAALYDVISGPAGKERDWNRFRSLFVPTARLIPAAAKPAAPSDAIRSLSVEEFVAASSKAVAAQGFYEKEIARRTESFGKIMHVFSVYESRHAADDAKPFTRGINSIQLFNDGKRWWVVNVLWDSERTDNPIPDAYLPAKASR